MSDNVPTMGDVVREEFRICMQYEKDNPGMTLDMNGLPIPKPSPKNPTAERCNTCADSKKTCGHGGGDSILMICCPWYCGGESLAEFKDRRGF